MQQSRPQISAVIHGDKLRSESSSETQITQTAVIVRRRTDLFPPHTKLQCCRADYTYLTGFKRPHKVKD